MNSDFTLQYYEKHLKGNLLLMKKLNIIMQIFQLIIVLWSKMYVAFTVTCCNILHLHHSGDVIEQIPLNDPLFLV